MGSTVRVWWILAVAVLLVVVVMAQLPSPMVDVERDGGSSGDANCDTRSGSCADCTDSRECVWCESSSKCLQGSFYGPRGIMCTDYRWMSCNVPFSIFFYGGSIMFVICCMFLCLICYTSFCCYARFRRYNRWKSNHKTYAQAQEEELDRLMRTQGSLHPETDARRAEFYEKYGRPGERSNGSSSGNSLTISSRGGTNSSRW